MSELPSAERLRDLRSAVRKWQEGSRFPDALMTEITCGDLVPLLDCALAVRRMERFIIENGEAEIEIGQDTGALDWIDGMRTGSPRVIATLELEAVAGCTRDDLLSALTAALDAAEAKP